MIVLWCWGLERAAVCDCGTPWTFLLPFFFSEGVIKLLKGLNPKKALGPDELHPRVLKELANELGSVFAHSFQQSLDTGEIPKEWLFANICPLFIYALACKLSPRVPNMRVMYVA